MNNKYARHTLLDLHLKYVCMHLQHVIDIPFKDLFLILLAFIRDHFPFLLLLLLSFAEVRFYDQFSFLKTPRCTKIKTRLLGLTRMSTKSQKTKKTVEEQLSKGCLTGTRGYVIYSPGTTPGEHVTYPRGIGK